MNERQELLLSRLANDVKELTRHLTDPVFLERLRTPQTKDAREARDTLLDPDSTLADKHFAADEIVLWEEMERRRNKPQHFHVSSTAKLIQEYELERNNNMDQQNETTDFHKRLLPQIGWSAVMLRDLLDWLSDFTFIDRLQDPQNAEEADKRDELLSCFEQLETDLLNACIAAEEFKNRIEADETDADDDD
jgi:hypothetical protein